MRGWALALALILAVGAAAAEPVRLTRAASASAFPRIAAPQTAATSKINAALARLDRRWAGFVRDCLAGGKDNEASRSVEITMRGARYLAVVAHDDESCGGAHPDESRTALTYDLTTGRPVDWRQLLGPRLVATTAVDNVIDGTVIGLVSSPELQRLYVRTLKAAGSEDASWWKDCAEVLADEDLKFSVWPDAKTHALMLEPELPHAVQACGDDAAISPATLGTFGASPDLIAALAR